MTKQVRDWQKDRELLQKKPKFTIDEVNHIIYNVAPYWLQQYAAEKERADEAESREKKLKEALHIEEWHEDYGDVLWWTFPIEEAPYCGNPLCSDWPGYHTHWTPFLVPDKEEEAK